MKKIVFLVKLQFNLNRMEIMEWECGRNQDKFCQRLMVIWELVKYRQVLTDTMELLGRTASSMED